MISDKQMDELRPLVLATFDNCNETRDSEDKMDVLECMINVFISFRKNP